MSKLPSDEELCEKLEDIAEYLGCNDMELKNEIIPLVNTQKRLYAEMVVGDWVKPTMGGEVIAPGQTVNIDLEGNMKESLIFIEDDAKWGLQREQKARIK